MIELSVAQKRRKVHLWGDWGNFLIELLDAQIRAYSDDIRPGATEWDTARTTVEYAAKKQALIDFKKLLEQQH